MNKPQTPMKRLQGNFKIFRELLAYKFNFVTLNSVKPKSYYYNYDRITSKGVESDHILIIKYKHGKLSNWKSYAFVFTYADADSANIVAQTKLLGDNGGNETIESSVPMNFDAFRQNLNKINAQLREAEEKGQDVSDVFDNLFTTIFLADPFELDVMVNEARQDLQKESENLFLEFVGEDVAESYNKADKALEKARSKHTKDLKASDEFKHVEELERQLVEARKLLDKKKKALTQSLNIQGLTLARDEAHKIFITKKTSMNWRLDKVKAKYPKMVTNRLKFKDDSTTGRIIVS